MSKIKILLIDDEPLHLIGMRAIIPWEKYDYVIVGEARNGEEGIEAISRIKPDIVIVDLVMPKIDGLEMIRRSRKIKSGIKFIICSCMTDIQYYKEAMKLGVSEYLEKEMITPEILLEAVNRVAEEMRKNRILDADNGSESIVNERAMQTEFLNLVIHGSITDAAAIAHKLEEWNLLKVGDHFVVGVISVQSICAGEENDKLLEYSVISICEEILGFEEQGCFFRVADRTIAALLPEFSREHMERMFQRMKSTVEQCLDCVLTMGLSRLDKEIHKLPMLYQQAKRAEEQSYFHGHGNLYDFSDLPKMGPANGEKKRIIPFSKRVKVFSGSVLHKELDDLVRQIREEADKKSAQSSLMVFLHFVILLAEQTSTAAGKGEIDYESVINGCNNAGTLSETAEMIGKLIDTIEGSGIPDGPSELIHRIKEYVAEHLYEKINLNEIAQHVYMSPSYISRIFKQETGSNLNNYIRMEKIEEAKKLLQTKPVGEVAELLGYNSVSHFVTIFSEQTNMTPYKYKKQSEQAPL